MEALAIPLMETARLGEFKRRAQGQMVGKQQS